MRLLRAIVALATLPLAVLPATVSHATVSHAAPLPSATYLALGDSVAAGVGASRPDLGYVPLVADALRSARRCGNEQTVSCLRESIDLSVAGATTTTLIATQLPAATSLLQARNSNATAEDDVRLITLTIGGNDLFQPVIAACQNPTAPLCSSTVASQLQQVAINYGVILGRLRAAAGRDTTIAVTTYYNGLAAPGCPAAALSGLAQVVLEGGTGVPAGLNDIIRQSAQASGAVVVETAPVVEPAEIRPDCLHPTDKGHADIAGAVTNAVLATVVAGPGGPTPTPTPVARQIQVDRTLIGFGNTHRLTVTGAAGAAVQLFGNGRVIRTATLPASGQSSWTLQPGDRTLFYAVVDGRQTASVTVEVRRTVSIGIRQDTPGVYTFTGRIQRAEAGVQVTIARLDSATKHVRGVASTRTTGDGRYEIRTSLPAGFAGYYALTGVSSSALQAGRSRLYGLVVPTRATPPTARQSITLDVRKVEGFYFFNGLVSGEPREMPVTLGRLVDGRLVGVRGGLTDSTGGYSIGVALGPGTWFFQVVTATARSRVYGLVVPAPSPGSACSATAPRTSYEDSARCLFLAFVRNDRRMAANYATPDAASEIMSWRSGTRDPGWSWEGCGQPEVLRPSSGVSCAYYDPMPGEVHGVLIEFGMARDLRVEELGTVG